MTCVVGLVGRGRMLLGGDSASTDGWDQTSSSLEKVWQAGDFLIGGAGSWRGLQLARYSFVPPKRGRTPTDKYMAIDFIDELRTVWRRGGHLFRSSSDDEPREETVSTSLIVAYRGGLWTIEHDLQIVPTRDDYVAIGSGAAIALGALFATRGQGATRPRLLTALRAASQYNAGVRPPFVVIPSGT